MFLFLLLSQVPLPTWTEGTNKTISWNYQNFSTASFLYLFRVCATQYLLMRARTTVYNFQNKQEQLPSGTSFWHRRITTNLIGKHCVEYCSVATFHRSELLPTLPATLLISYRQINCYFCLRFATDSLQEIHLELQFQPAISHFAFHQATPSVVMTLSHASEGENIHIPGSNIQ